MNYSRSVMLINDNIRAVKGIYEPDTEHDKKTRYVYKTLDASIKEGDYVLVPTDTRHNMTVVQITDVDVDIDYESGIEIKWVISKIDATKHDEILEQENKWIEELKKAEKRRKREELKKSMLDMYADADMDLESLPMSNMNVIEDKKG